VSTTDHPPLHSPVPNPHGVDVLHQALGAITVLDRTSIAGAVDELVAVAERTGHAPLCVARAVLHLLDPENHPTSHRGVVDAVHKRWAWPLHQHRHPTGTIPERVWAVVLGSAAATRPPVPAGPGRTTTPVERTPRPPRGAGR
jgi:hypothetical protein